jgi:RND family efflux transporter MFP subunit
MSKLKYSVVIPLIILVIVIVAAIGLASARKPPEKKAEVRLPLLVEVVPVQPQQVTYQIKSQGAVSAKQQTSLVSEVNGRLVRLADVFVEGGFFQAGELLAQIEPADYVTNVKATEATLANAQAALEEEKARVRVAEEDWRSFQAGKAPALGLRRPQLASALARVRSAEADVERAKRELQRTEIRAPYAGIVQNRAVDLGQFVSRGNVLGTIMGTDVAEVRLPLTDHDLAYLDLAAQPAVTLSAEVAGQQLQWQARLVRTEGVLDERSRVIYAVAEVTDPYQLTSHSLQPLRFGRFVQASIQGHQMQQVTVVPRHLLRPGNELLVVDSASTLQLRQVQLDRTDEQQAFINSGFRAGDQILISPVTNPLPGLKVRLSTDAEPVAAPVAAPVQAEEQS